MNPIMTYLAYSGGVASHALIEMVLRGDIQRPPYFLVLTSDPGMEDERTYPLVADTKRRCNEAGIAMIAPVLGKDLYRDLITMKERGVDRVDHPPYWTRNRVTGKRGRLKQKCTSEYKIRPMHRALRAYLHNVFGINPKSGRVPPVEAWIGFTADEARRADRNLKQKEAPKFIRRRFPLVELGLDAAKIHGYYMKHGIVKPPRSVCCACFANGLSYYEDMYENRPDDWDKAVAVDEAVRNLEAIGVNDEVFVSSSLVPLKDLPAMNFKHADEDYKEHRCNSGVCYA